MPRRFSAAAAASSDIRRPMPLICRVAASHAAMRAGSRCAITLMPPLSFSLPIIFRYFRLSTLFSFRLAAADYFAAIFTLLRHAIDYFRHYCHYPALTPPPFHMRLRCRRFHAMPPCRH